MTDIVLELRRIAGEIDRGAGIAEANLDQVLELARTRPPRGVDAAAGTRAFHQAAIANARKDAALVRAAADLVERLRAQHRVADP